MWKRLPEELRTAAHVESFAEYVRDVHPLLLSEMKGELRIYMQAVLWGLV